MCSLPTSTNELHGLVCILVFHKHHSSSLVRYVPSSVFSNELYDSQCLGHSWKNDRCQQCSHHPIIANSVEHDSTVQNTHLK